MKISKAIEILDLNLKQTGKAMPSDCRDAVKLASEALKRHGERHHRTWSGMLEPLPGEDPE